MVDGSILKYITKKGLHWWIGYAIKDLRRWSVYKIDFEKTELFVQNG
jgi:hypothetical protein